MNDATRSPLQDAPPAQGADGGGLREDVFRLLGQARALAQDQWLLLVLEARAAARAAGTIAVYAVAAGMLLAFTGLGLVAACALWLAELGMRPSLAVLVASLLLALGLWVLVRSMRRMSVALSFPATRESLRSAGIGSGT